MTHQPDIVERLRTAASNCNSSDESNMLASQAADEIERLRGENFCLNMQIKMVESHFKDIVILCSIPKASLTKAAIREAEGRIG